MRIDPSRNSQLNATGKVARKRSGGGEAASASSGSTPADSAALGQVKAMVEQLIDLPDVREEMVDLGKRLAEDPRYPGEDVIEEVARILSRAMAR